MRLPDLSFKQTYRHPQPKCRKGSSLIINNKSMVTFTLFAHNNATWSMVFAQDAPSKQGWIYFLNSWLHDLMDFVLLSIFIANYSNFNKRSLFVVRGCSLAAPQLLSKKRFIKSIFVFLFKDFIYIPVLLDQFIIWKQLYW